MGSYYPKAHNQREPKHCGGHQGHPNPLAGHLSGHISLRQASIKIPCHCQWGEVACFIGQHLCRPRCPLAHWDCCYLHLHISSHQERQNKIKPRTSNRWSNHDTQMTHQPWQWRHVGGQFWRDWWWLRVYLAAWKLAHELGRQTKTRGPHTRTLTDVQDHRRQARWVHPSSKDLQLSLQDRS